MKFVLVAILSFSLQAMATEEMCEEQTSVLKGSDIKFISDLAKRHEVPQVAGPSLIKRQFEIELEITNQGKRFTIKTPIPLRASSVESAALDKFVSKLHIPSDNLGGPIVGTSIWLVENNGQPDLGEWYVNYTCYDTEGTSTYLSEERSLQESDITETSARLPYADLAVGQ